MDLIGTMRRTAIGVAAAGAASLTLSGCATVIHGTRQEVGISSTPTGALVDIDGTSAGITPVVTPLSRKTSHTIRIELAGYQPYATTVTHSVSGWVWGNLVIGGLIGLAVDAVSGGIYTLSPEQVSGQMLQARADTPMKKDGISIAVVLKPEAGWVKVGQLTPEPSLSARETVRSVF